MFVSYIELPFFEDENGLRSQILVLHFAVILKISFNIKTKLISMFGHPYTK